MSKAGHINKYIIIKREYNGAHRIFMEVWRMDNKNAHLHRTYDSDQKSLVYPSIRKTITISKFENALGFGVNEIFRFDNKEEYHEHMFVEQI